MNTLERIAAALNEIPVGPMREAALVAFREEFVEHYFFVRDDYKIEAVANND